MSTNDSNRIVSIETITASGATGPSPSSGPTPWAATPEPECVAVLPAGLNGHNTRVPRDAWAPPMVRRRSAHEQGLAVALSMAEDFPELLKVWALEY